MKAGRSRGRGSAPRPVVLKLGGELLEEPGRAQAVAAAIAGLSSDPLVVVHGGGKDIDAAMARAGISRRQVDGLRVTDEATLEVVVAVLAGTVNTRLVAGVGAAGGAAVGLTAADAGVSLVEKAAPHVTADGTRVDLGRVGIPVDDGPPQLLLDLCRHGYVPIVASIGAGRSGELYNVNADTLAAHLAAAVGATRLVIAGGTAGVLDTDGTTIPRLDLGGIDDVIAAGTATAGMIAKLSACRDAVRRGVSEVLITSGHDLAAVAALVREGRRSGGSGYTVIEQEHRQKPS